MPPTIADVILDHVALAVERWSDAWPRYAIELGGVWSSGGVNVGFGPAQLRFANDGRVEILQPWRPENNPFLRRFLDRHGPGPHHLTFKVPDLSGAIDLAREAGFSPVGVDLRNAEWKEAFLHPRQATGIVVQLAQAAYAWQSPAPEGFPTDRRDPPASLLRVTHAVDDLDRGLALFEGLLGGQLVERAVSPDRTWEYADLQWPGPPAFRLIAPARRPPASDASATSALSIWLGATSGRLHHLVFATSAGGPPRVSAGAAQAETPGVLPADGPAQVIEPSDNLGTRLVLVGDRQGPAT